MKTEKEEAEEEPFVIRPYLKSEPAAEPFPACSAEMQSG
jgi:hypothetical protein